MTFIVRFTESDAEQHDLVGGKATNLGHLVKAGFAVPAGFTVTTLAYAQFMNTSGLQRDVNEIVNAIDYGDVTGLETHTIRIRSMMLDTDLPTEVAADISQAYRELGEELQTDARNLCAVRSSGTAEDLADSSFAGLHDTYLDIGGIEEILAAVKRCWSSLWTARATAYRHDRGFAHNDARLAVVIQSMVDADVAGVMFTANPVTAAVNEIVVNASWGLGESVVSGIVTPDEYVIARGSLNIKQCRIGSKALRIVRDGVRGQGTIEEAVPTSEREKLTLSDRQVTELAHLGQRVAAHFGDLPQDIEWALADDSFYLLQARPVTGVEFSWDEDLEYWQFQNEADDTIYTRAWADEYWNGPITPLHYSYRAKELSDCHHTAQTLYGNPDIANMRTWKYYKSEAYFASNMEREWAVQSLPQNLRIPGSLNKLPPSWWPAVQREPFSWFRYAWIFARIKILNDRSAPFKFFRVFDDRIENRRDEANGMSNDALRVLPDNEFKAHILDRLEIFKQADDDLWGAFFIYAPFALGLLGDLLGRWYDGDAAWAFADLCSGLPDQTITLKENHELWKFGERLKASPALRQLVDEHQGVEFFNALEKHEEGRAFLADYRPWLARRGHRGHADRDGWFPRRGDDPMIDYNAFKALVSARESVDPLRMEENLKNKRVTREAEVHLSIRKQTFGLAKLKLFKLVHAYSLEFLKFRDNEREYLDNLTYTQRRCFLELGRRLHERKLIADSGDVWFLGVEENFALLDASAKLPLTEAKIAGRKRNFFRFRNREVNLPNYLNPNATPALPGEQIGVPCAAEDDSLVLAGAGTSQGNVTGRARVIKNLEEIGSLVPGDILVCNSTDPGWTPAFLVISGLVLETGGMLSHGACLSREYGLPAAAVPQAMSRIVDGSTITVDGTLGLVRLAV
ncbi:MAG: phosphoenolpyruvate synthase/pyruvate phosphate dikinase [Gammaproteobacteria bacterium]|jgi:phosphoenolpyruvate synthase/pyruvate phosphate dikinase